MTYSEAFREFRKRPNRTLEQWKAVLKEVTATARPDRGLQTYTTCPVCDTTLDWAWCPTHHYV